MARKSMTKQIEEQIQKDFATTCKANNQKPNEVMEALMQSYINGDVRVKAEYSMRVSIEKK